MLSLIPDTVELLYFADDSEDTRRYRFRLTDKTTYAAWQQAQPGQFFMLNLPHIGEAPFTFTSPPNEEGEFSALIRQMGQVTTALFAMKQGAILGARGPFGRGWPVNEVSHEDLLIVAGGCGLAPLVNLIDTLISQCNEQQITLIYGARSRQTQMLSPERDRWQKDIAIIDVIETPTAENELTKHGLDTVKVEAFSGTPLDVLPQAMATFSPAPTRVLVCGPEIMMHSIADHFIQYGLSRNAIFLAIERRMHCAVGLCGHCYVNNQYVCKNGPTFSWQELQQLNISRA